MTMGERDAREPSVAVIVPNYNDARYLQRCIRSVLDQEVPPDELIVVDDRSSDDSVDVIRSSIKGSPGAVLIENQTNLGTLGAIDVGLRHSRSDYVLFLSANDFVLPGIFAHAKTCLAKYPGAGLWSAMGWIVDESDRPVMLQPLAVVALDDTYFRADECLRLAWRFGSWFTGTTLIYQRATLESVGRFDPAYKGLSDLITALMVAGKCGAVFTPRPFAVIRMHSGSYLSNTLSVPSALDGMLDRLREHGASMAPELFTPAFMERIARRFRFAAIRASKGERMAEYAGAQGGLASILLAYAERFIPKQMYPVRVAVAFLVLRPFDVWPSIWNRFLGSRLISLRAEFPGRSQRT